MSEFVFTLPAEEAVTPSAGEGVGERVTDHVGAAQARLAYRFQKTRILQFLGALVEPVQRFEDTAWQVFTERSILNPNTVGAQLDQIGAKVGQPRLGMADADYRRILAARISANRSDGLIEDLITITRAVVDDEDVTIEIEQQFPAAVVVRLGGAAVTTDVALILIGILRKAVAAGVRCFLEYLTAAPSASFSFAGGAGLGYSSTVTPGGGKYASVLV